MDLRPGSTPIIFLSNYISAKLENKNPSGSIKDRITEKHLNNLKNSGVIKLSDNLLSILNSEFAVSFAFFCAKKGFNCNIITSDKINKYHLDLCKILGATMYFVESDKIQDFIEMKEHLLEVNKKMKYIDFIDEISHKNMYDIGICHELKHQLDSSKKNVKRIFLCPEMGVLAKSLKDTFPDAKMYGVEINNSFFTFNGNKRDIVENINFFVGENDKKIFEEIISIKLDRVVETIKDVAKKSGLIMDYKTAGCYLAAKDNVCFNNDVNLIIFYENGERYIEEILSI